MGEKEDLDRYFAYCRRLSERKRAKKAAKQRKKQALKGLSRTERMKVRGKGILHSLDTVSKRAAKFDIDKFHKREEYLAGGRKREKKREEVEPEKILRGL